MSVSPVRRSAGTRSRRGLRAVQPGSRPPTKADDAVAKREYVAGGGPGWSATPARSLPHPIDDLTADWGNEVYEEMLKDPQVAASIDVLKTSILEDGLMLAPAVEDQKDEQYKQAVTICDHAIYMFERLVTPLDDVLFDLLDGVAFGNRVAELVSEVQTVDGTQLLNLVAIKPKPREFVAFVVDQYMNVLGLLGVQPGLAQTLALSGSITADKILRRDKFAVFTHRPVNGDPRGTSILRPAYEPWWKKRQLGPEYLRYLSQFASPSVWATVAEGTEIEPATDTLGNVTNSSGEVVEDPDDPDAEIEEPLTAQDELLAILLAWRNGYAMALPAGTNVHTIEMLGDGSVFLNAFQLYNAEIVKAILNQQLATEEGQHQARSAATVHQDVLDTLVRQGKKSLVRMVTHDILVPWVRRNWGDKAAEQLVPVASLGTTERQDLPGMMTAVAALMRAAYFHSSQLPAIDDMLSLPTRDLTQHNDLQPIAAPAPGESSAPGGGDMGKGGNDTDEPNPGAPSGPAQRGGRGAQPKRQPTRKANP